MLEKDALDPQCITYSQMNLIFNLRIYLRRLAAWISTYLISRYMGLGTTEDLFSRLYLESLHISNMLELVFGREYSEQYGRLESQFAITMRDLIDARLRNDMEAVNRGVDLLYQNISERSAFLASLNPYWDETEYSGLFATYAQYILEEDNAIAANDYSRYIELSNLLAEHTEKMGDTYAEGIYRYINSGRVPLPDPGSQEESPCITYEQMNAIYNIRMFWFELAIWIRSYMISRYEGRGDSDEIYAQLLQEIDNYIANLKVVFGDRITEEYRQLFVTYLGLIDALITAQIENNIDEINRITQLLYQNVDERAAWIKWLNPFIDEEEARDRFHNDVRNTIDESTSFLRGDYARNIDIFSRLLDQAESNSNFFARGLFQYVSTFPLAGQEAE